MFDIDSEVTKPRETPYKLRLATMEDLPVLIELSLELGRENGPEFPSFSLPKLMEGFSKSINDQCVVLLENNGIPIAVLGVCRGDITWFSDDEVLTDIIFYIRKDFRSTNVFNRLLSVLEEFGKINALPVNLMFWTTHDLERKFKLLTRRGYKPMGFWVVKGKYK